MKKIILLFVALFVMMAAHAQFDFCIGPRLGYQTTKLSFKKENIKSDFKGNMILGVFGRITIDKFVLQPELLYYKSGKMMRFDLVGENVRLDDITVSHDNFALPVLLGYQFVNSKNFNMRVCAGPVFYFAVGKMECFVEDGNKSLVIDDAAQNTVFGGVLDLGVDIWRFTLDIGYSLGLSQVFDKELQISDNMIVNLDDARQNVFTVTLGFKFL